MITGRPTKSYKNINLSAYMTPIEVIMGAQLNDYRANIYVITQLRFYRVPI